jgi:hypothetical protein
MTELFKVSGKKLLIHPDALRKDKALSDLRTKIRRAKALRPVDFLTLALSTASPAMAMDGDFLGTEMFDRIMNAREKLMSHVMDKGWKGVLTPEAHKEFMAKRLHEKFPLERVMNADFTLPTGKLRVRTRT